MRLIAVLWPLSCCAADPEGILYFDKRRWLWQFDIQEDRRYLYALPQTRNTTDLVDVLKVPRRVCV